MSFRKQLFAKKSLEVLLEEMAGEHRLRRVLGPVALSSLGIGAIIGTGIFVLTGVAARQYAGPGPDPLLRPRRAGLRLRRACAMPSSPRWRPIAGSAYTYAYISLGELVAWIIGWDLVLEYAMASATVANGWAHYFLSFLGMFKDKAGKALLTIPVWLATDPFTAATQHIDYLTAEELAVASATALPWGDDGNADRAAGARGRAEFTAWRRSRSPSRQSRWPRCVAMHGKEAAEASIERVRKCDGRPAPVRAEHRAGEEACTSARGESTRLRGLRADAAGARRTCASPATSWPSPSWRSSRMILVIGHPRERRLQRGDGDGQDRRGAVRDRGWDLSTSTRRTGRRSCPTAGRG